MSKIKVVENYIVKFISKSRQKIKIAVKFHQDIKTLPKLSIYFVLSEVNNHF